MRQLHSTPVASVTALIIITVPAVQTAGPTGRLNDTGQSRCLDAAGTALEACTAENSGDASSYPRQDGRFGRDPSAGSGGNGGFAFTPLDVTGNPPVSPATLHQGQRHHPHLDRAITSAAFYLGAMQYAPH